MTTPRRRRSPRVPRNPVQLALIAAPRRNPGRHMSEAVTQHRQRLREIRDEIAASLRGKPRFY